MNIELQQDYEPQFSGFRDLMKKRVREILVLSSLYDNFVIEEDVALSEKIFSEYIGLNLYFVPRIKRVSTAAEAFQALKDHSFDLVITMPRIVDMDPFEFGRRVKEIKEDMLIFLLSYNTVELERISKRINRRGIDRIFYWSGDSRILLAIVKYTEDLFNLDDDAKSGTRIILLVEDNPMYYSSLLPIIYKEVMTQTRLLISESLNDFHRMLRMRARPKIMLAETYEEAMTIYRKYKQNILGVISDFGFPRENKLDPDGGLRLIDKIKSENIELPVLLHSSDESKRNSVEDKNVTFLYKNSYTFHKDIRDFMNNNFGFGDFIFRFPDGREVDRAKNLQEMARKLRVIPVESFEYHAKRNHISTWLMARTEFDVAKKIRPAKISDFKNIEEAREYLSSAILDLIENYHQGVIADFKRTQFDPENIFVKLGNGSFGGKGRCIAFINLLLAKADNLKKYEDYVEIKAPRTTAICTDVFEEFLERNQLKDFAIKCTSDDEITNTFIKSPLPEKIQADLYAFLDKVHHPIAVRSSSLLEDSHSLPFAGIYNTYMLPNNHSSNKVRLKQLSDAIKLVYASTFFQSPKAYARNTSYRIEEQKMAVIIQQLVGEQYGDSFYPIISGVAQSYNFYPFSHMNPEDGIAHLALGLGKTVVEGGRIYSFSPAYPRINPIHSSPAEFMKKSQSYFYALNMGEADIDVKKDDISTMKKLPLQRAEEDGTLYFVASTYSVENQAIRDTLTIKGPRVITFANILKYNIFPLAEILKELLNISRNAFASAVEIEFAVNLYKDKIRKPEFYFLQVRPLVAGNEHFEVIFMDDINTQDILCITEHAMGNGIFHNIYDLVYVDPEKFDISKSRLIAEEVGKVNRKFIDENRNYILLGFGRWGTSDPWLGIPVEWSQICQAKVIIESNLLNFKVDPSQGSHFFHNITSLRLGYLFIQRESKDEFICWQWIKEQRNHYEGEYIKHIRLEKPFIIKIDGRSSKGVLLKPE